MRETTFSFTNSRFPLGERGTTRAVPDKEEEALLLDNDVTVGRPIKHTT